MLPRMPATPTHVTWLLTSSTICHLQSCVFTTQTCIAKSICTFPAMEETQEPVQVVSADDAPPEDVPEEVVLKKPASKASKLKAAPKKEGKPKEAAKKDKKPKAAAKNESKPEAAGKAKAKNNKNKHEEPEIKPEKRSAETFAEKASKWKQGDEQQDLDQSEGEAEGQETTLMKRDYAKARKFKRLQDINAIPQHIQELMDKAKTRSEKSQIINDLFETDGKGNILMKPNKPQFRSSHSGTHERFGRDQTIAKPKDVFLHSDYHGDQKALDQSIEKGTVMVWTQDGVEFAGYRQTNAGISKRVKDKHEVKDETKVNEDTFKALSKAFTSMAFTFGDDEGSIVDNAAASSSSKKPAGKIEFNENMKNLVTEAKGAMERLYSAAMKLLGKCSNPMDKEKFKPSVMAIKSWIAKDEHLLTWGELEGGAVLTMQTFQAFMSEQADSAVSLNESFEQFKALLRTRKEL